MFTQYVHTRCNIIKYLFYYLWTLHSRNGLSSMIIGLPDKFYILSAWQPSGTNGCVGPIIIDGGPFLECTARKKSHYYYCYYYHKITLLYWYLIVLGTVFYLSDFSWIHLRHKSILAFFPIVYCIICDQNTGIDKQHWYCWS